MTNLLWPGDHRAGDLMTDQALLRSMVAVESAWLNALAITGIAPSECADVDLWPLMQPQDRGDLAASAEASGVPVVRLVAVLRARAAPRIAHWIHRGLTSQDVIDTGLMLATRAVVVQLISELAEQISTLVTLITTHRGTPMVARTLTQHALPTTFGAKAVGWLSGIVAAYQRLNSLDMPVQIAGAAGTLAATTELAILRGIAGDPGEISAHLVHSVASTLGLETASPWHTTRTPITAAADTFVTCTDAWGRIASNVVTLARPEIGELSEPTTGTRGGSSTLPDKRNPVLSILIRRTAIAAPPLASTLHTAAALANDERPDGAWHVEWDILRTLARRTVVAGGQCGELLSGLEVHSARMAENLYATDVLGEQRVMAAVAGKPPSPTYRGAIDLLVDEALDRAQRILDEDACEFPRPLRDRP